MNPQKKRREVPPEPEIEQIQVRFNGEPTTIPVYSPAFALETVFERLRSKLINRAFQVTKDRSTAEDIVQASLLGAYCWLNNGTLYAIRRQRGYLLVKGDGSTRSARRVRRERQEKANRQAFERLLNWEEKYYKEIIEPAMQTERLARMIEQWLKGIPVMGMSVIDEPSAWMQKIVLHNALKYYNQQKKYQEFLADPQHWDLAEDPRCPNPEKELIRKEDCTEVRQCVAALPAHYREVVELRYLQTQDYSFQAIAEQLNRPVHTVTSQASRALDRLRIAIEEQFTGKNSRSARRKKRA